MTLQGRDEDERLDALLARALNPPPRISREFRERLDAALAAAIADGDLRKNRTVDGPHGSLRAVPFKLVVVAACTLLLAVCLAQPRVWDWLTGLVDQPSPEVISVTRVGGHRTIALTDGSGSIIVLNTNSAVGISTSESTYRVRVLKGEVLFDMRPNPHRHFTVALQDLTIVDTATVFAAQIRDDGALRVTVQEGSVLLSAPRLGQTILAGSEQVVVNGRNQSLESDKRRISPEQIQRQLSWRGGYLRVVCATLSSVVEQMNRYNLTKIKVSGVAAARLPVGGTFATNDPVLFAKAVAVAHPQLLLEQTSPADGIPVLVLRLRPGQRGNSLPWARDSCDGGDEGP